MKILYVDDTIAVAVKDRGVLSQEGAEKNTMPALLREELGGEVFCVHRLDRETAGVMVFARTKKAAAALSLAFAEGEAEKEYFAIVKKAPEEKEGTLSDLLFFDRERRKAFPVKRDRKGVKQALLRYRLLEEKEEASLLSVCPVTGRTHQIRVQFASRKMPLWGDRKYGGSGDGFGLFAHRITFFHPETGKRLSFSEKPENSPWDLFF